MRASVPTPPEAEEVEAPPSPPVPRRFVVMSARIPVSLDVWKASSEMHEMLPRINQINALFAEIIGDPNFRMTEEFLTPRPEGVRRRGRRAKTDPLAGEPAAEGGEPENLSEAAE